MPTDAELIAKGTHVTHKCGNVIPVKDFYCKFCHKRNEATSADSCPTCGQKLPKK